MRIGTTLPIWDAWQTKLGILLRLTLRWSATNALIYYEHNSFYT
jgi:hypothetical protein